MLWDMKRHLSRPVPEVNGRYFYLTAEDIADIGQDLRRVGAELLGSQEPELKPALAARIKAVRELPLTPEQKAALAAWQAGQGNPGERPPPRRKLTLPGGLEPAKGARKT